MTRIVTMTFALVLVFGAASASAQCCPKRSGEKTSQKTCGTKTVAASECSGPRTLATGMPLMHYVIGDKTTACPKQAADWKAAHANVAMHYKVSDKTYCDSAEAKAAYTVLLADYLDSMSHVKYTVGKRCVSCPAAAKSIARQSGEKMHYQVGPHRYNDQAKADKAIKLARQAADNVAMKLIVDGKEYDGRKAVFQKVAAKTSCCEKSKRTKQIADAGKCCGTCDGDKAKCTAKKDIKQCGSSCADKQCKTRRVVTGDNCEYTIGTMKTACGTTANLELAKARVMAANDVLAKMAISEVTQ